MKKSRKVTILTCLDCGQQFKGGAHLARHVKNAHGYSSYNEYKIKHGLIKTEQQLLEEGAVKCQICGLVAHDLTSHIIRMHEMSISEYKEKYGEIRSQSYLNDQSERITGEKNPGFNHGGKLSPFSENYIYADVIDKEELLKKVSDSNKNNGNNDTTLVYWTKRGYTEEEAKEKVSERQRTFTLEKCIEKYGEKEGTKRWADRQEKWLNSISKCFLTGFSKISQELFWKIFDKLDNKHSLYFAELGKDKLPDYSGKNNEYIIRLKSKVLMPDFYDKKSKKIIEFDGTYWHGEHIIRSSNVKREQDRNISLIESGYQVLHIKEEDYRKDPEKIVNICLEFLNG